MLGRARRGRPGKLREAAAWLHDCTVWDQAELDAERPLARCWELFDACACGGETSCQSCGGLGMVMRADPRELLERGETPGWLAAAAPALRLRARIERLGLPGAMLAEGVSELHPMAVEAVEFLDGELARLERLQRRGDAERRRRERRER